MQKKLGHCPHELAKNFFSFGQTWPFCGQKFQSPTKLGLKCPQDFEISGQVAKRWPAVFDR
jgi:hypothetical protein